MPEPPENDNSQKTSNMESLPSTGHSPLSRIGPVALECAEQIEDVFGSEAQVLAVVVVAEVIVEDRDGHWINSIEFYSSESRRWVQAALLREATDQADKLNDKRVDEVDEALEPDENE